MNGGPSPIPSQDNLQIVAEIVQATNVGKYAIVSALSILLYEWLANFEQERQLIHGQSWTSIKITYLLCRYYPIVIYPVFLYAFLVNHTEAWCQRASTPLYTALILSPLLASVVVAIRAHAFTGRTRPVLFLLVILYLAVFVIQVWYYGFQLIADDFVFGYLGDTGCWPADKVTSSHKYGGRISWVVLSVVVFDLTMLVLVLAHACRERHTQSLLGRLFIAQGLGTFLVLTVMNSLVVAIFFSSDIEFDGFPLPYQVVLPPILSCRMILHLRHVHRNTTSIRLSVQSRLVREGLARAEALEDDNAVLMTPYSGESPTPPIPTSEFPLRGRESLESSSTDPWLVPPISVDAFTLPYP